jgi:hypothetical protein
MAIKDDMEDVQEAVINELITENGITNTLADDQVTESKILNGAVTTAKIDDGAVTPEKLSQAYLPLTGGTAEELTINKQGQSQSLVSVGGGSTNAALSLRGSTGSAYAWQISSNAYVASALEFTRSTAVGNTTFSTPSMVLNSNGNVILSNVPTSATGLTTGTIYSDGGTLKIV